MGLRFEALRDYGLVGLLRVWDLMSTVKGVWFRVQSSGCRV